MGTPLEGVDAVGVGYGEGLELAAGYLANKPDAENTTVMSWYAYGPFSYYYPGKVKELWPHGPWSRYKTRRLGQSEYLVIYYAQQQRRNAPATLLQILKKVEPEHVIWLNGIEYVHIYRVSDLPPETLVPDP